MIVEDFTYVLPESIERYRQKRKPDKQVYDLERANSLARHFAELRSEILKAETSAYDKMQAKTKEEFGRIA